MNLRIHTLVTGPFQENCFILWWEGQPGSILIDPGDNPDIIKAALSQFGLAPVAILNTHAHLDHINAVQSLKESYGIPFYLHREEKLVLNGYEEACRLFGIMPGSKPEVDIWFDDNSELTLEDFTFQVIPTPGHTPGGVCFNIAGHLFSGDTLFKGSVGRTDLPGGNWSMLEKSLLKLMTLVSRDTIIHSGHGPETSLELEMLKNPFLIPLLNKLN